MWNGCPTLTSLSHILHIATKQQQKVLNLESFIFFEMKNSIFCHFFKIWKFNNPRDMIKSKLGQKRTEFVSYIPTVITRSDSTTMDFSRLVIHFWDQFVIWPIHNPSFWRHSKIRSKEPQIWISSIIGKKGQNP